jgi:hypothetical protein
VKQSSTFEDVADHILLQEDGDLLTIHQAPDYTVDNRLLDTIGIPFRDENREINAKEEAEMVKNLDMFEPEDKLNRFVSTSSSIQTIVSKTDAQIKGNLSQMEQSESEYNRKFPPGVNLCKTKEQWI